ncbi:MAG TPA: phage baseplate assembly protein V [Blastocatellia bacterium]
MDERDLYELAGDNENTGVLRDHWAHGIPAIVANVQDPENRHRIQVIIPDIDESEVCPKWVERGSAWFQDGPGFGDYHLPGLGTEVFLSGTRGEKYHLRYYSRNNENYVVPPVFAGRYNVRGYATNGDYEEHILGNHVLTAGINDTQAIVGNQIIGVGGNQIITVGGNISITAGGTLTITANQVLLTALAGAVEINAPGGLMVNGVTVIVP